MLEPDQSNNHILTLEAGLTAFWSVYMPARSYAARTLEEYEDDLSDLIRFLRGQGIDHWAVVGLRDLQHYLAELDRLLLKPASRNRKTCAIKTYFRFLVQSGYLSIDPAQALIPPAVPRKERRYLREEEYQALLPQAHSSRDRAILVVFLQTGLRLSELAHLNLGDLRLPKRISRDPADVGFLGVRRKRSKRCSCRSTGRRVKHFSPGCESAVNWPRASP